MAHLTDKTLIPYILDAAALSEGDAAHLAACADCRAQAEALRDLARSFAVARHSRPSATALAQARALFTHVQSQSPARGLAEQLAGWVRATLGFDTRRTAAEGVRGSATAYRLLYTTTAADVELAVEPAAANLALPALRIEGELLPLEGNEEMLPALLQLEADDRIAPLAEAQTNADGRFHFDSVVPGRYRLWITFAAGGDLLIEGLELS